MGLKEMREVNQKIEERGFDAVSDPEFQEKFQNLMKEMDENWDAAKERLCQNHTETEVEEIMNEVRLLVVSSAVGKGLVDFFVLEINGKLKTFSDIYVMAVIGALIMEGIL